MIYPVPTTDIIASVVAAMPVGMEINSVALNEPNTYLLDVCDVRWAQKGFTVLIDAIEYTILSVNYPNEIIVTGAQPITAVAFDLYRPFFFHGTPLSMNVELDKKKNAKDKIPMVWLMEQFVDTFQTSSNNPIERKSRLQIFFLSTGDRANWQTDDAYKYGILPMQRMQKTFELQMAEMQDLFVVDAPPLPPLTYDLKYYHQFGVYIINKGMPDALWVDNLAGVEMNIPQLQIFADGLCKFNCANEN